MDKFIDVSNHQGVVNWDSVRASGRTGAICKATEGATYKDPTFHTNFDALGARNMVRGAYHFAHPDNHTPATEANFFLAFVGAVKPSDILVLDIEVGTGGLSAWALEWLQIVHTKTGILPWVYSYGPFLSAHLTNPGLAAYPLWLAAYQSIQPPAHAPWTKLEAWQHSSSVQVPGVSGNCDESYQLVPLPPKEVKAMYSPNLVLEPIAASLQYNGGTYLAADSGAFYAFGAPAILGANGQAYFSGRHVANLYPGDSTDPVIPAYIGRIAGGLIIQTTSNEWYGPYVH